MRNSAWAAVDSNRAQAQPSRRFMGGSFLLFWCDKDSEVDIIGNKIPLQVSLGISFRR
jgi:hypothetical protein